MAGNRQIEDPGRALHYIAPTATLLFYLVATFISVVTLQNLKGVDRRVPRKTLLLIMSSVPVSYTIEAALLLADSFAIESGQSSVDGNIYALSNILVWVTLTASLKADCRVWYPHYGSWLIALFTEAILFILILNRGSLSTVIGFVQAIIRACRVVVLILLLTVLFAKTSNTVAIDEESDSLLGNGNGKRSTNGATSPTNLTYGATSTPSDTDDVDSDDDDDDYDKKRKKEKMELQAQVQAKGNWFTYARSYSVFVPFLWPSNQYALQLNILGVLLCILGKNALNLLEPRQFGIVLDTLNGPQGSSSFRQLIHQILLYVLYRWIRGSVLSPLRHRLWLPVQQNALKSLETASYNQVMALSMGFHTEKKSGELYQSIDQGSSLVELIDETLFHLVPVLIDLVVAITYLYHVFGPYMTLDIAATSLVYLGFASYSLRKSNVKSRKFSKLLRKKHQVMYDGIGGWATVSYFNRLNHEKKRYSTSVATSNAAYKAYFSLFLHFNATEETIIDLGLTGAALLAIYQIVYGNQPIGNFAMLISYWGNFTGSLWYLVGAQRQVLKSLVDAEALLKLFQKIPTIRDGPQAFEYKSGSVDFCDVDFSYDGKKNIIKNFSFHANPGQRVALVGETGGGKSTILKLLFRFYDAKNGSVMIDGQNVKDLTMETLRRSIGVVPQDPSMFNDTVMENVRYSNPGAADTDVIEACKAAAVHEKILSFPKGYATRVGEGGVKLSGGELQRIAIARVILQNPNIILLDEATSAVDSETEAQIQGALERLTRGRTTFTVAHRLSTITNSDIVLVIKSGEIIEQGSPKVLLEAKGKYHDLWLRQIGVYKVAEEEGTEAEPDDDPKA